jgi:hypothetical protein
MTFGCLAHAVSPMSIGASKKHIDIHNLCEACAKYPQIPTTFDGSLPSEGQGKGSPIKIGQSYFFDCLGEKGQLGTVTTATVLESEKQVHYTIIAEDGTNHLLAEPISDEALADYKAHPEAFFGAIQRAAKRLNNHYELFEFSSKVTRRGLRKNYSN